MESRPEPKYKYKILTGHIALAVNGVPAEFAAQCMLILAKYRITAAWRVGEHAEPDKITTEKKRLTLDIASHPKPSDVKEKSSNWGFTRWFIADNPLLGKYNDSGEPMNIGAKRSERTAPIEHHVSLRFILSEIAKIPPTMRLDEVTKDNQLIITCLDAPEGAPDIYRVNLNNGFRAADIDAEALRVMPDSARAKPEWWPEELNFGTLLDQRFPVECRVSEDVYEPVNVLGIRDSKTGAITPIITDMDLLWVSEPGEDNPLVKVCANRNIPLFSVINCYNPWERQQLAAIIKKIVSIDTQLYHDHPEHLDDLDLKQVSDETLSRMGCVTPFTAYFILLANQRFRNFVGHIDDLMQHSAEIYNPFQPSALGATLNINGGMIVETFCEEDQILFTNELIEEGFHLRIHPKWDMNKWGIIVEKMISCGGNIPPDVRQAYDHYHEMKDSESQSPIPPLLRRFSKNISETAFALFTRKSSTEHTPPLRKDSTGPFYVQARCREINIHDDKSSLLGKVKTTRLSDFCKDASQLADNERWHNPSHNIVELSICDESGKSITYTFKIEAMKISLVGGDVNETSINALKRLSDLLFDGKKVEILAATREMKDLTEKTFFPPESPRLN